MTNLAAAGEPSEEPRESTRTWKTEGTPHTRWRSWEAPLEIEMEMEIEIEMEIELELEIAAQACRPRPVQRRHQDPHGSPEGRDRRRGAGWQHRREQVIRLGGEGPVPVRWGVEEVG